MRAQHSGEADDRGIRDNATLEIGYHVIGQQPATEGFVDSISDHYMLKIDEPLLLYRSQQPWQDRIGQSYGRLLVV